MSAAGKVTKVTTKPAANNLAVAAAAVAKPAAGVAAALTSRQGGGRGRGNSKVSVDDIAPPVKRTRGRKAKVVDEKKEGNVEPSPMDVRNNGGLETSNNSHDLTNKTGGAAIIKTDKKETDAVATTAAAAMDTSPVLPAVNGTGAVPQTKPALSAVAPVSTAVDTPAVINGAPVVSDKMFVGCHASAR